MNFSVTIKSSIKRFCAGLFIFVILGEMVNPYVETTTQVQGGLQPPSPFRRNLRLWKELKEKEVEKEIDPITNSNRTTPTPIWSDKNKGFEGRTLSEEVRTVLYNDEGDAVILTLEEVKRGKRLFNVACGSCHVGGLTKTNPNVGLDIASLNSALPPRNNISSLVNFLNSPKSYDGFQSIAETHPSIESCDLFPKMRTLTREDLVAISGHILLQTKILNERWGGGKIYY